MESPRLLSAQPSPRRLASWNASVRFVLMLGAALALASCASVHRPAWPPRQGEPVRKIRVYAERYHSSLALPATTPGKKEEEWSYGERLWFYDEREMTPEQRRAEMIAYVTDTFRALFWPNAGVIEVTRADKTYDERNPQSGVTVWEIPVSEEGLRRMREYLDQSIGSRKALLDDGGQTYYTAATRYHVFHTCHHYVAGALVAGGVPVHPGYCLFPSGLWMQLNRLQQNLKKRP